MPVIIGAPLTAFPNARQIADLMFSAEQEYLYRTARDQLSNSICFCSGMKHMAASKNRCYNILNSYG